MKITQYLCQAEQTVQVKAYASKPDPRPNAPSRGIQSCRTEQTRFGVSSKLDLCVNKNSTASELVSTDSGWLWQHCLLIQLMKEKSV